MHNRDNLEGRRPRRRLENDYNDAQRRKRRMPGLLTIETTAEQTFALDPETTTLIVSTASGKDARRFPIGSRRPERARCRLIY